MEEITMMYWYGSGMSGWGYALMTIGMVLFWGAVIAGIVALVRYVGRSSQHSGQQTAAPLSPQAPERLLAERFARGEIDEEEYRRRLAALQGTGQATNGQSRPPAGTGAW
ncbi:MAG: SHOCT domain-containing protein [Micromonosporaceae bacterium]